MRKTGRDHGLSRSYYRAKMGGGNKTVLLLRAGAVSMSMALVWLSAGSALAQSSPEPTALPAQIGDRLAKCWSPPKPEPPQLIEVTVRLRLSRAGALMGEPRVAYVQAPVDLREAVSASALTAVKACTPLALEPSLGAAIAGRVFAVRFRSLTLPQTLVAGGLIGH